MSTQKVLLIRHGETEWSLSGQHTGTTDIPLTENGRVVAKLLKPVFAAQTFALVLSSPLWRARETCDLAGLGDRVEIERDLAEWDYGEYEGLTPQQIHVVRPGWMIFTDGCPGGESPDQVEARIDRVIGRIRAVAAKGNVAVFSHGHLIRAFAAKWLGLRAAEGRFFLLDPATVSVMSYYRGVPAVKRWNAPILSPPNSSDRLDAQSDSSRRATSEDVPPMAIVDLTSTAEALVPDGTGILAADETSKTLTKCFDALSIHSTPDTRRGYREMLFGATGIGVQRPLYK